MKERRVRCEGEDTLNGHEVCDVKGR